MNRPKIYVHGSYIGNTGFNNHTRDFFRKLSKYCDLKVRNYTVGPTWKGYNLTPHDEESYINEIDKKILYEQNLWTTKNQRENFKIYPSNEKEFIHDFNIVLNETNHHFFYDNYTGPKIGYCVWETTELPKQFFDKLMTYDEVWVPSKWQKECLIKQGMGEDFIKVVPEGVDSSVFFPEEVEKPKYFDDDRFKFLLFGRWDYRKSTKEIIETFLKTFDKSEPVDLIVSIDNPWGKNMDGFESTEQRLNYHKLNDERIKIIHFPSRDEYVRLLKTGHVFVSCARSEGWNLPLIEAMACGTPSIYSNCSGQLEFAEGLGIPVESFIELPAKNNTYSSFNVDTPGNYYEPNFDDLSEKMRFAYEFYSQVKDNAVKESKIIRDKFDWNIIGEIGRDACLAFYEKINDKEYLNNLGKNVININYLEGPRVEITGKKDEEYFVEFLDESDRVVHSARISTNMWTHCSRKYYTKWKIRINGQIYDEFNLEGKKVLISIESKSVGDTLAWAPYAVEFQKKHNCAVYLSTFHNDWFEGTDAYKDIKFIKPGSVITCDVVYRIGWFKEDKGWTKFELYPKQVNLIPLQQTASDILGLEFKELNHGVKYKKDVRPFEEKYIVFGPQATAGCKEWSYNYWVKLSKYIIDKGYKVVSLTKLPYHIDGVTNIFNSTWDSVFNTLYHAEFMIGLGSGLSWLNWSLNKKTVVIAGFSNNGHEFMNNAIRVTNNVCIKCWNDPVFVFDSGDWNWCPVYKNTPLQHICQKSITPEQVFFSLPFDDVMNLEEGFDWGNSSNWFITTIRNEIFINKIYERFFEVEDGDVVVDIGSSIGPFPYSFKNKKVSHVYCLEPNKNSIKYLERNLKNINSTIINKGISNENGVADFKLFGDVHLVNCEGITFEDFVKEYKLEKIDFLKLDCEGGEYSIFNEKNKKWIENNIRKIVGEFHLSTNELKNKFDLFRNSFLKQNKDFEIFSVDGKDIKSHLWSNIFLDYYDEVIIYIRNF